MEEREGFFQRNTAGMMVWDEMAGMCLAWEAGDIASKMESQPFERLPGSNGGKQCRDGSLSSIKGLIQVPCVFEGA